MENMLLSLKWKDFGRYPKQGTDICLHCANYEGTEHKFVEVKNFNAAMFKPNDISRKLPKSRGWDYTWLPLKEVSGLL